MYPHRIRLRGPWEYQPLRSAGESASLPAGGRMTMPCRWADGGLAGFAGQVRFRRHFGFPGRIDPHERVWLTFAGSAGAAVVQLNGESLGMHPGDAPFEFDVTGKLKPRNDLIVDIEGPEDGGLCGEVALEVRCPAFLRGVRVWSTCQDEQARLHVRGEVVGASDGPLELYVLLDGKTLIYRNPVIATPEGQAFEVMAEQLDVLWSQSGDEHTSHLYTVRIDLVRGPVVWYAIEEVIEFRR